MFHLDPVWLMGGAFGFAGLLLAGICVNYLWTRHKLNQRLILFKVYLEGNPTPRGYYITMGDLDRLYRATCQLYVKGGKYPGGRPAEKAVKICYCDQTGIPITGKGINRSGPYWFTTPELSEKNRRGGALLFDPPKTLQWSTDEYVLWEKNS